MSVRMKALAFAFGLMSSVMVAPMAMAAGGEIVIASVQGPPSLDAHVTNAQVARNITLHIYETLYARNENAEPVPDLASGVSVSDDGLTYTFKLREGVKFHNGKEMTSEDVVASIERYRKIGVSPALVAAIDTVSAVSPYEVAIKLKQKQSVFLDNISSPRAPIAIYPAEEAAKGANEVQYIGTGPFKFVEYQPDSHVTLEKYAEYVPNPAYDKRDGLAGKKEVLIDRVVFRFIPEAGARTAALESGAVQIVETVDGPTAERLRGDSKYVVHDVLPFAFQVIKLNHNQAPTDDVNFRKAVQAALDMEEVMEISYAGINQVDGGWVFPTSPFASDAGLDQYNVADFDKAKAFLDQSNYKGEPVTFITDNLRPNVDIATVFQARLEAIGVKVDIVVADWPTTTKVGFSKTGWNFWTHGFGIEPFEGPGTVMSAFVNGNAQIVPDPEIDRIAGEFNATLDEAQKKDLFKQFQLRMLDNVVAIKTGNYGLFQVTNDKVENFVPFRIPRMWGVTLAQ
ncbi:ABC transporter substrate-binding protein [Arvimicrobium flavum]|uniref:ABC transporter substrate-binding protein n=1 Tax=Arvimicrobium flavum TaxID=3393320 RepID=UPI00237BC99D|nr:ABC transporter substrate-binding protein [Mesorhizobium shangrilense]